MKILAIDTSSKICSVALYEDDQYIDELNIDDGKTHSENLMPLIDKLINKNNLKISDINMIACSVGPGSFTGIRIGVSSVKPIAEVLGIKLASVTSLEALARNVEVDDSTYTIVSLIDARNNQVYAGIFDNKYNPKEEYMADDINEVINKISKYKNIIFVGDASILYKDLLLEKIANANFSSSNDQTSKSVALIGYKKYLENNLVSADEIIPIYLRKSQAERMKK